MKDFLTGAGVVFGAICYIVLFVIGLLTWIEYFQGLQYLWWQLGLAVILMMPMALGIIAVAVAPYCRLIGAMIRETLIKDL